MKINDSCSNDFLNVLIYLQKQPTNPFEKYSNIKNDLSNKLFSPFIFYEDIQDKEVRCPICLGRVSKAKKPLSCIHVFCSYCINKWLKIGQKCPVCRQKIDSLIDIDINDKSVPLQYDLYIS